MSPDELAQIRERDIEHEHQSCSRGLCAIADRDRRALLAHISYLEAQMGEMRADARRWAQLGDCKYDPSDVIALIVSRGMFMSESDFDANFDSAIQEQPK